MPLATVCYNTHHARLEQTNETGRNTCPFNCVFLLKGNCMFHVEVRIKPGNSHIHAWCDKEWDYVGLQPDPCETEGEAIALARELWRDDGEDKHKIQYRVRRAGQDCGFFHVNY